MRFFLGLKATISWFRQHIGNNSKLWQWGKIHRLTFVHTLGEVKLLNKVFNRGPFPIGGDTDTPFQTAIKPNDPFDFKLCGPTFRQILVCGDWDKSLQIYPIGQSGAIGSANYDNWMQFWQKGSMSQCYILMIKLSNIKNPVCCWNPLKRNKF